MAWVCSDVPVKFDDFDYLRRALIYGDDWTAPITRGWFSHFRPGTYALWWALGPLSLAGTAIRVVQVGLWVGIVALLTTLARRERGQDGVVLVLVLLLSMSAFWELLDWKSWLTSLGTLTAALAGVHAWRRRQLGLVLLAGLLALLFKETGPFLLGWLLLLTGKGRDRVVGGVLLAAAVGVGFMASERVVPGFWQENLHFLLVMVPRGLGALVPVVAALTFRSQPFIAALVAGMATQIPELGGVLTLAATAYFLRRTPMWLLAAVLCWAPTLFAAMRSQVYLLEGFVVVLLGVLFTRPMRLEPRVWGVAVVVGLLGTTPFFVERPVQWQQAREQRQFLADFHPEPARFLYTTPRTRPDIDQLVWYQLGAENGGPLPRGAEPVQVGPRSGVWADVTINGRPFTPTQHRQLP